MKRSKAFIFALAAWCCMGLGTVQAQDLKSILSGVASGISKVVTGNTASATSIIGTWKYVGPACELESDNLIAKVGGEVASKKVESSMEEICNKIGLSSGTLSYTFNEDGSYSQTINGRNLSGTYTFNETEKTVTMKTSIGLSFTAHVSVSGSTLNLLFKADKLLSLLKTTAGIISKTSTNSALSTLSSLSDEYNGVNLGFELTKQ